MKLTRITILLATATCLPFEVASANDTGERRPAPPPAAFDACTGKAAGDSCTVSFRDRTIDRTCRSIP